MLNDAGSSVSMSDRNDKDSYTCQSDVCVVFI